MVDLPSENMRFLNTNQKAFANGLILRKGSYGNFANGIGGDGSIKSIMANYLINQDYIYLFNAILSLFTDPLNGLPSFDKYFTESANSHFLLIKKYSIYKYFGKSSRTAAYHYGNE